MWRPKRRKKLRTDQLSGIGFENFPPLIRNIIAEHSGAMANVEANLKTLYRSRYGATLFPMPAMWVVSNLKGDPDWIPDNATWDVPNDWIPRGFSWDWAADLGIHSVSTAANAAEAIGVWRIFRLKNIKAASALTASFDELGGLVAKSLVENVHDAWSRLDGPMIEEANRHTDDGVLARLLDTNELMTTIVSAIRIVGQLQRIEVEKRAFDHAILTMVGPLAKLVKVITKGFERSEQRAQDELLAARNAYANAARSFHQLANVMGEQTTIGQLRATGFGEAYFKETGDAAKQLIDTGLRENALADRVQTVQAEGSSTQTALGTTIGQGANMPSLITAGWAGANADHLAARRSEPDLQRIEQSFQELALAAQYIVDLAATRSMGTTTPTKSPREHLLGADGAEFRLPDGSKTAKLDLAFKSTRADGSLTLLKGDRDITRVVLESLVGEAHPIAGTVLVRGVHERELDNKWKRKHVVGCPAEFSPLTLRQMVHLSGLSPDDMVPEFARYGLHGSVIQNLMKRFSVEPIGSVAQQQRAGVIIATKFGAKLGREPQLVLIDQPMAHQTTQADAAHMRQLVVDLRKEQRADIIVTGESNLLQDVYDGIVLIDRNRGVLASGDIVHELYGGQRPMLNGPYEHREPKIREYVQSQTLETVDAHFQIWQQRRYEAIRAGSARQPEADNDSSTGERLRPQLLTPDVSDLYSDFEPITRIKAILDDHNLQLTELAEQQLRDREKQVGLRGDEDPFDGLFLRKFEPFALPYDTLTIGHLEGAQRHAADVRRRDHTPLTLSIYRP
jgi:hypothetical protein